MIGGEYEETAEVQTHNHSQEQQNQSQSARQDQCHLVDKVQDKGAGQCVHADLSEGNKW